MKQLTRRDGIFIICGMAALALFIVTYPQVYWDAALQDTMSRDETLRAAHSLVDEFAIPDSIREIEPDVVFHADRELIQFLQERLGLSEANRRVASSSALRWRLTWKRRDDVNVMIGRGSSSKEIEKAPLRMDLDNRGKLQFYEFTPPVASAMGAEERREWIVPLPPDSARAMAAIFLKTHVESPDRLREKGIRHIQDGNASGFEIALDESPDPEGLLRKVKITVMGNRIVRFERLHDFPADWTLPRDRPFEEFQSMKGLITMILLIIVVLVFFLRQMSRGLLDRRMAIFAGVLSLVTFGVSMSAAAAEGPWWTALIIVFFGGGFWALINAVVVSTGAGIAHQTWPDKYKSFEGLRLGKFLNQRVAAGVLRGLVFGVIALGLSSLVIRWWPGASFLSEPEIVERLNPLGALGLVSGAIGFSLFHVHAVYLIILSSLAQRRWRMLLYVFGALLGAATGFMFQHLSPWPLNLVVLIGFGLLMTHLIVRYDVVTAWAALLFMQTLQNGYALFLHGDVTSSSVFGAWFILIAGVLIMGLTSKDTGEQLEDYEPEYLRELRDQERMEREFEIARHIQTTMLCCRTPQHPFVDIASICDPAHEVGGDYYDFVRFGDDDRKFAIAIGDVSGKGVSAAFYMTLVKGILQTQAQITPDSPRDTLVRVNDVFCMHAEKTKFISMLYAVFDLERRTIRMARAGHNPLLVRKSHLDDIQTVSPPGIAIGLSRGEVFSRSIEETEVPFQSGDIFVFYTDGFTEAMNKRGEEFGEARMMELIHRTSHDKPDEMIAAIRREINAFAGTAPQHDDMTMIVVKIQ